MCSGSCFLFSIQSNEPSHYSAVLHFTCVNKWTHRSTRGKCERPHSLLSVTVCSVSRGSALSASVSQSALVRVREEDMFICLSLTITSLLSPGTKGVLEKSWQQRVQPANVSGKQRQLRQAPHHHSERGHRCARAQGRKTSCPPLHCTAPSLQSVIQMTWLQQTLAVIPQKCAFLYSIITSAPGYCPVCYV